MTTTSANIAGVMIPLGWMLRRVFPGEVIDVDDIEEITPTGSRKRKLTAGVYELFVPDGDAVVEAKDKRQHKLGDKGGVWRTIRGRKHFFSNDKTGPIPSIIPRKV
ncbi:MAG: hypothetical protein PHI12_09015 [Dehalococcoidales bacterium]|nr:hypothetical protein [Dehalococcoidales bacterium]